MSHLFQERWIYFFLCSRVRVKEMNRQRRRIKVKKVCVGARLKAFNTFQNAIKNHIVHQQYVFRILQYHNFR